MLSEVEDRYAPGSTFFLEDGSTVTVESSRPHRDRLLVRFEELPNRTAAESLNGQYLFVDASEVPAPAEGSFWPHELEGSQVLTEDGRSLGRLTEVVLGEANDIWVTTEGDREILIPALKDVVVSVDTAAKRVVVREVPGITD